MTPGGMLVLIGTPLGNRGDLSPRARQAVLGADVLLCEDTRSPRRLLGEDEPLPPRVSCFVGNEHARVDRVMALLGEGKTVAYVSEAGLPGFSDPGRLLVAAALDAGFAVDVIPGPTAATVALLHSGFVADEVRFLGFVARSGAEREALLAGLAHETATTVIYEAPGRIGRLLADLAASLPDGASRRVAVARELTKLHQEVVRGTVAEVAARFEHEPKGEITVVLAGAPPDSRPRSDPAHEAARAVLDAVCDASLRPRERARRIAEAAGLAIDEVYDRMVRRRHDDDAAP